MINEAQVFLAGYVAREPRFRFTTRGISSVSLRVACTPRWVDRETGEWTDGETSFVTVLCWRTLADNVAKCLHKGEPVLVKGRLTSGRTRRTGRRGWRSRSRPPRSGTTWPGVWPASSGPGGPRPRTQRPGTEHPRTERPRAEPIRRWPLSTLLTWSRLLARRPGLDGAGQDGAGVDGAGEPAGVSAPF